MAEFVVKPITKLSQDTVLTTHLFTADVVITRRFRLRIFLGKWLIYLAARVMGCGMDIRESPDA